MVRRLLISLSLIIIVILFILPLGLIFYQAFNKGWNIYIKALMDYEAFEAVRLSLIICSICLIMNLIFGVAIGWIVSKFDFFGKNFLVTIVDLPFAVPPVIVGLIYILLFGYNSKLGNLLIKYDIQIIFNLPGMILTTLFVTFPIVSKEIIPLMINLGKSQEESALIIGANGKEIIFNITLPNIKWSLITGLLLANSRAMGEYGSVSIVSGHIRGLTDTIPLYIESLYNEYNLQEAFAISSVLVMFSIITILAKYTLKFKSKLNK